MAESFSVLISSAGANASLVECFRDAARQLKLDLRILAADPDPRMSAACRMADESLVTPECTEPSFVPELLETCRREKIDLLLPTADPGLVALSEQRGLFESMGTHVVVSDPAVVQLCRDKLETARALKAAGITVPDTMGLAEFMHEPQRLSWPVIAKPIGGTSSVGIIKPRRLGELQGIDDSYIVQEIWQGREFTVNVYFDRAGRLHCAIPHWRIEVRNGVVFKAETQRKEEFTRIARRLESFLAGARGPICFQAIMAASGEVAVFEINARIGQGYPLAHHAGANFARWLLEEAAGLPATASDQWREGVILLRYDAAVFV